MNSLLLCIDDVQNLQLKLVHISMMFRQECVSLNNLSPSSPFLFPKSGYSQGTVDSNFALKKYLLGAKQWPPRARLQ